MDYHKGRGDVQHVSDEEMLDEEKKLVEERARIHEALNKLSQQSLKLISERKHLEVAI